MRILSRRPSSRRSTGGSVESKKLHTGEMTMAARKGKKAAKKGGRKAAKKGGRKAAKKRR